MFEILSIPIMIAIGSIETDRSTTYINRNGVYKVRHRNIFFVRKKFSSFKHECVFHRSSQTTQTQ